MVCLSDPVGDAIREALLSKGIYRLSLEELMPTPHRRKLAEMSAFAATGTRAVVHMNALNRRAGPGPNRPAAMRLSVIDVEKV